MVNVIQGIIVQKMRMAVYREYNAWKLWCCSLASALVGSKALVQTLLFCPAKHKILLSILLQAVSRSDDKRYNFSLRNPYSATILQTNNSLVLFQQCRTGPLKICFDEHNLKNQWQNQGPSHSSIMHFGFTGNAYNAFIWLYLTLHICQKVPSKWR